MAAAAALLAAGLPGAADAFKWTGTQGGRWEVADNWDVGGQPAATPPTAGSSPVIESGISRVVSGTSNVNSVSIGSQGWLRAQSYLRVGSSITVDGQLSIEDGGTLLFGEGPQPGPTFFTLLGIGTSTRMSGGAIGPSGSGGRRVFTVESMHTLAGHGTVGEGITRGPWTLENRGNLVADVAGQTLALQMTVSAGARGLLVQQGQMRATQGGTLLVGSAEVQFLGSTRIDPGSEMFFSFSDLRNGTLDGAGGGLVRGAGSRWEGMRFTAGTLYQSIGSDFQNEWTGTIHNDGALRLVTDRIVASSQGGPASVSFVGQGSLELAGQPTGGWVQGPADRPARLTNGAGHTVFGVGSFGATSVYQPFVLDNAGLFEARGGMLRVFAGNDSQQPVELINTGTLAAAAGSRLSLQAAAIVNTGGTVLARDGGQVDVSGRLVGGTVRAEGSGLVSFLSARLADAVITGDGQIELRNNITLAGTLVNHGRMRTQVGGSAFIALASGDGDPTTRGDDVRLEGSGWFDRLRVQHAAPPATWLVNGPQHLLTSPSLFGVLFENQGVVVDADIDGQTAGRFVNTASGVLRSSGRDVIVRGASFNDGLVELALPSGTTATHRILRFNTAPENLVNGGLNGGQWVVRGSAQTNRTATLILGHTSATPSLRVLQADLTLQGRTSGLTVGTVPFQNSMHTVGLGGALRLLDRDGFGFAFSGNGGNFTNRGEIQLADASFRATTSLRNEATGLIRGWGTVDNRILNSGTVQAEGGLLWVTGGIDGQSGLIDIRPGASLRLGGPSDADFVRHEGQLLDLQGHDLVVARRFDNRNATEANGFDPRAGVAGSGRILAGTSGGAVASLVQSFGGDVRGGVLDFGTLRQGTSLTLHYGVLRGDGPGPDLSGALIVQFDDARLSGVGAASQRFVAAEGSYTPVALRFTASDFGPLAGQAVQARSDFANVETVQLAVQGRVVGPVLGLAGLGAGGIDFGTLAEPGMQQRSLTIANDGSAGFDAALTGLSVLGWTLSGPQAAAFSLAGWAPGQVVLAGSPGLQLDVGFAGGAGGAYAATLTLFTDIGSAFGSPGRSVDIALQASVVPEPGSWALLLAGVALLAWLDSRRHRRNALGAAAACPGFGAMSTR